MAKPISRKEMIRGFSGARHQSVDKGELKVRNPHRGGNIDWSLVKEVLRRQAGIKPSDWDEA